MDENLYEPLPSLERRLARPFYSAYPAGASEYCEGLSKRKQRKRASSVGVLALVSFQESRAAYARRAIQGRTA
jgi:hypothetical protein